MRGGQGTSDSILYGEFASRSNGNRNWGIFFDQVRLPLETANSNWYKILGCFAPEQSQKDAVSEFIRHEASAPTEIPAQALMALCLTDLQVQKAQVAAPEQKLEDDFLALLARLETAYEVSFSPHSAEKQYADVLRTADEAFFEGRSSW